MASNDIVKVLIIILAIDVLFFLGQFAILEINPSGPQFINSSFISDADVSGGSYVLNDDPSLSLPETEGSISPTTGNVFTDALSTTKTWLLDSTGLGYFLKLVGGPVPYLASAGLPQAFIFAIGAIWYLVSLFLLILVILGRY